MANPFYAIRNFFIGPGAPPVNAGLQTGLPAYPTKVNREVTFDSAMSVSAVWAAVRLISESVASLPFSLHELDDNGVRREMDGDLANLLKYRPNNYQTCVEFWETMVLNLVVSGNAYAVKQRSGNRLGGLMPLSSTQVETELLQDGAVTHRFTQGSDVKVYSQDSIWHIKLFGNGIIGLSPLSYASDAINIAQNADNRVNKIYSNGAKPAGVLMIDRTLTDEQRQMVRDNFKNLSQGDDDRLFVLEADMKYQQVSMSPQDIQLLDSRRFQIEDIGRFFGVPSVLLNQTVGQSSLGSNVQEIMQAYYKLNLRPYLEKIEASVVRWLVPPTKQSRVIAKFDFDALLRADTETRMRANREAINSGQLTPNEARADEGRPPLDGGDTLLIQGAMIPIEDAGKEPEPPPEPQVDPPEDDGNDQFMRFEAIANRIESRMIKNEIKRERPIIQPQPTPSFTCNPTINIHQDGDDIKVTVEDEPHQFEFKMPEVTVTNEQPSINVNVPDPQVTVVDNHPTRAVQTVERDNDDDITRTIIDYERG